MAATSNPYRRKQDAILGIDVSNQHSRPSSQATFGRSDTGKPPPQQTGAYAQYLTPVAVGGKSLRSVRTIPAQISQFQQIPEGHALNADHETGREREPHNLMDIRREIESVYNGTDYADGYSMSPTAESHNPYAEDDGENEDEDDDEEEYDSLEDDMSMYASSVMPRRRTHRSKRMAELQEDSLGGRSSSALGFRSNSTDSSTALPSKAERMLGMAPKRGHSTALAPAAPPRVHKSKKGGLAPKAQRLLGVRADALKKSLHRQQDQGSYDSHTGGMTMERSGSEVDDFKKLLLGGRTAKATYRKVNTDSISDASSLSRSSIMDSQTSRSSREMLSPDAETPTWTATNSAPPPWLGVHPAFRKKHSVDSEAFSPISPSTVLGAASSNVPMFASFKSMNDALLPPNGPVELDAGPIGPPSPVELPVPESDMIARSTPSNIQELSSLPPSPTTGRPRTAGTRLGVQRSSSSLLAMAFGDRPSSADDAISPMSGPGSRKSSRPSAIFENPNIFEMAGDMPEISAPVASSGYKESSLGGLQLLRSFPTPPTPPPSSRAVPGKASNLSNSQSASPPQFSSPHAPPSRPLPAVPGPMSGSGQVLNTVNFDTGRTRQQSEDVLLSPHSADDRSLRSQPSHASVQSLRSNHEDAPPLTASSVPSPLAMAAAEGRPITKEAPPPLRSPNDYPLSERQLAAQADKKRVELSDKDKVPPVHRAQQKLVDDDSVSVHRPFSWQSTRTTRSMRLDDERATPPMPPPLALKIPSDAVRAESSNMGPGAHRSGAVTATPLTATSARSRASRLQKALEQALSKDGMDKAVMGGEKIEDLFRSAGAEELFLDCSKESRELIGLEPGEDTEEAKQAHQRAQDLLKDLGDLQKEVDQLRKMYEEGGPLQGLDLSKLDGASTI